MTLLRCQSCGRELSRGGLKYVVEVKSFADFDGYLEDYPGDIEEGVNELLDSMENMDSASIEDDVYQEMFFIVCKSCRDRLISDPFHTGSLRLQPDEGKGTLH